MYIENEDKTRTISPLDAPTKNLGWSGIIPENILGIDLSWLVNWSNATLFSKKSRIDADKTKVRIEKFRSLNSLIRNYSEEINKVKSALSTHYHDEISRVRSMQQKHKIILFSNGEIKQIKMTELNRIETQSDAIHALLNLLDNCPQSNRDHLSDNDLNDFSKTWEDYFAEIHNIINTHLPELFASLNEMEIRL